jgi:hypothetical protein
MDGGWQGADDRQIRSSQSDEGLMQDKETKAGLRERRGEEEAAERDAACQKECGIPVRNEIL